MQPANGTAGDTTISRFSPLISGDGDATMEIPKRAMNLSAVSVPLLAGMGMQPVPLQQPLEVFDVFQSPY